MNLVAKEFIPRRDDENAVLVRSQLTGAALELERIRSVRTFISEFNVQRWTERLLVAAARVRSRDRLTGRLTDHLSIEGDANWQ